jgi:hypothetical protein
VFFFFFFMENGMKLKIHWTFIGLNTKCKKVTLGQGYPMRREATVYK